MSLSGVIGWVVIGSLSVATLWVVDVRGQPAHRVSFVKVVGLAFLVATGFEAILVLRVGLVAATKVLVDTFPFTWLQCFVANWIAKLAWDQRAKSASAA